jgi:hypothetical protein
MQEAINSGPLSLRRCSDTLERAAAASTTVITSTARIDHPGRMARHCRGCSSNKVRMRKHLPFSGLLGAQLEHFLADAPILQARSPTAIVTRSRDSQRPTDRYHFTQTSLNTHPPSTVALEGHHVYVDPFKNFDLHGLISHQTPEPVGKQSICPGIRRCQ